METLLNVLGGPVEKLLGQVRGIVDDVHTSDEERQAIKQQLLDLERKFHRDLLEADATFAKQQAKVVTAEVSGKGVLARNWRPILMLTFTYIIAHNFVLAPVFDIAVVEIPVQMWGLLKIGVGGYIMGRSAEKIAPGVLNQIFNTDK